MIRILKYCFPFFLVGSLQAQSSDLFLFREYEKAYRSGSRSMDGRPGPTYWQNKASYDIQARIDVEKKRFLGQEQVVYYNNSPDSLSQIVVRLYQDMYKEGNLRDRAIHPEDVTNGVNLREVLVSGKKWAPEEIDRYGTNLYIDLEDRLLPGDSLELYFSWTFKIPEKTQIRMGAQDSTSFFMAYWYPQVARYDDIYGWDTYHYANRQEFNNDYADFDVKITLPDNQKVWATGELQNPGQVLSSGHIERLAEAVASAQPVLIDEGVYSWPRGTRQWHFTAQNVTDFAFGFSDHYRWEAVNIQLPSGREILLHTAYAPHQTGFRDVLPISKEVITFFSNTLPGIDFPYTNYTVFNGLRGNGMEFPMMANNGPLQDTIRHFGLTAHEIFHTYLPFLVGINERRYTWMEEGWALFFEMETVQRFLHSPSRIESLTAYYQSNAGETWDIPLLTPSILLRESSQHVFTSYVRPAIAYRVLREAVGPEAFQKALKAYIQRWEGKHPTPYDFFFTFEDVLRQDLSWLWKPWFFEWGYPDLAIAEVKLTENEGFLVQIRKNGRMPTALLLTAKFIDGSSKEWYYAPSIWKEGLTEFTIKVETKQELKDVVLGSPLIPDAVPENNVFDLKKSNLYEK